MKVQVEVLGVLVEAPRKHDVGSRVLAALGNGLGWELGALWELDGDALVARSRWRAGEATSHTLDDETARTRIAPGRGLPGRVWGREEPLWCEDITLEPELLRAASARADGFRTAVFVPLVAGGETYGVIELLRRDATPEDREVVDALARLGRAIATYLARARSRCELEATLRAVDAELQDRQRRLAREIHDILGQELTGLRLDTAWVARRLTPPATDLPAAAERLGAMARAIDGMLETIRRIALDLRAGRLDELGLAAAVGAEARSLATRAGISLELDLAAIEPPPVHPGIATAAFRAAQELLTNVVRHASASRVAVALHGTPDTIELRVSDDGIGIDPAAAGRAASLGLLGIRERAVAYGGRFEIAAGPGERGRAGTVAVVRLPRVPPEESC